MTKYRHFGGNKCVGIYLLAIFFGFFEYLFSYDDHFFLLKGIHDIKFMAFFLYKWYISGLMLKLLFIITTAYVAIFVMKFFFIIVD